VVPSAPPLLVKAERTSVAVRFLLSLALVDGALDIVLRHRDALGVGDREAQARVHRRVRPAHLGGDRDLLGEAREEHGALLVLLALAVLDVRPFAMAGHG